LEEVHEEARGAVQSRDRLRGGNALETAVAEVRIPLKMTGCSAGTWPAIPPSPRCGYFLPGPVTISQEFWVPVGEPER